MCEPDFGSRRERARRAIPKVSIYLDARKRPGFSSKVYPGIEEARFAAWRALLWFRAKIGDSPEVSTL